MVRERRNTRSPMSECYAVWILLTVAMKAAFISRYSMAGETFPPKGKVQSSMCVEKLAPQSLYEPVVSKLRWQQTHADEKNRMNGC